MIEEGIWFLFILYIEEGEIYKYVIEILVGDVILKVDLYVVYVEVRLNMVFVVFDIKGYEWNDKNWNCKKKKKLIYKEVMIVYELYFGFWKKKEDGMLYFYREMVEEFILYVVEY